MVHRCKKIRLAHRHPQHRHLQSGKPDPHHGRNALFHQDALEQQGHDLDRGALDWRGRSLFQRLLALVQLFEQGRGADLFIASPSTGDHPTTRGAGEPPLNALLGLADGGLQPDRRRLHGRRPGEVGHLPADEFVEAAKHRFCMVGATRKTTGARHHASLFANRAQATEAAGRA